MKRNNGPWTINSTRQVYQNAWIDVREDQVLRPDGAENIFSVVTMKPGVTILPLDEDNNTYLAREFRYGLEKETIECITGGIDSGESPLTAGQRELAEEAGIQGKEWKEMGIVDPHTSAVVSPVNLFLVRYLTFIEPQQEGTEIIQIMRLPLAEAVEMAYTGKITHAASVVALLKAERYLKSL